MKTIATILTSAALMLAATGARADDQSKFDRLVHKHVPELLGQTDAFTPKTLCICLPPAERKAGVLLVDGGLVGCLIPTFVNGSVTGFQACTPYVVLGK